MRVDFSAQLPGVDKGSSTPPAATLFVGNIGDLSAEELRDVFKQYSVVDSRTSMYAVFLYECAALNPLVGFAS